ncbi:hypothetical protein [Caballeronia arationis]|uniref:hypothetical protein n=1 Tax=Caballeronia arationis TaxID=1777142 RepID=UPI00117E718C|nr:hypothetical protein [Caballeronia arationis]
MSHVDHSRRHVVSACVLDDKPPELGFHSFYDKRWSFVLHNPEFKSLAEHVDNVKPPVATLEEIARGPFRAKSICGDKNRRVPSLSD